MRPALTRLDGARTVRAANRGRLVCARLGAREVSTSAATLVVAVLNLHLLQRVSLVSQREQVGDGMNAVVRGRCLVGDRRPTAAAVRALASHCVHQ